jgi:pyruvate/2-oxoacid:ferredoxin oxidoreductase alpha subunit
MGKQIHPESGFVPVELHLEDCTSCGLCMAACPEPYGLMPVPEEIAGEITDPKALFGPKQTSAPDPYDIPDESIPLPPTRQMVLKGTYAAAVGAILAGCRHFFGYPITPSTEGAELMAKLLPHLDGVFVQAVSEVATINHMYGCGGAGLRSMTFTSSPGLSLMVEGISYMVGAEVPGVIIHIMRGGPGLGNIAPEQADIKMVCRGLGHGNTCAIVLTPTSPQEMLDLTMLAFELSFKYRNPVIVLGDGYLGQITGKVSLPDKMVRPGIPKWAVYGDEMHRRNLICSIQLSSEDLEKHNRHLNEKYETMQKNEQRADLFETEGAEILVVACNTPSRMARGAVQKLRDQGYKVGLFRPITLWPFPIDSLKTLLEGVKKILVVEASYGQLENELRLALSHAGLDHMKIEHLQHYGGVLPQQEEIIEKIKQIA